MDDIARFPYVSCRAIEVHRLCRRRSLFPGIPAYVLQEKVDPNLASSCFSANSSLGSVFRTAIC